MYIVTFYSFKGGVGRTMAMVNVAAELLKKGRKVLAVDFDLEAPGLDTFTLFGSTRTAPGVVDFVWEYLETRHSPDVLRFVHHCPAMDVSGGKLWIMPTGKHDELYANRLNGINWQKLYSEHDGYLLFEDLKAQWRQRLNPDYVLVDSRTGHTDVGGICTRHLPDAVVILFFPNEQNLQGLQTIVKHIRSEAAEPRKKSIDLHFVTSNIPDLDDEDHLLASRMERFKEHLGYETLATSIHHYNSLALLNQTIFTVDRPRSRLAQEYRELTGAIIRQNLEDTEGALDFLEKLMPRRLTISIEAPAKAIEERLGTIRQMHSHDGRILYHLGRVLKELGRVEEALDLFSQAADNAYSSASMLLDRAQLRRAQGNTEAALGDVRAVLNLADATYFEVSSAVRLLVDHDPDSLGALPDCQAFRALNDQERSLITRDLMFERRTLAVAERVLRALLSVSADVDFRSSVSNDLVLCLIGQGQFTEAMNTISPSRRPVPEGLTVYEAFNYAMAEWAETGRLPRDLFGRVVACDAERPLKNDLNKLQCGAIAHWALGDIETAGDRLREARDRMKRSPEAVFSSWRYLMASPRQFMEDLTAMTHLINGAPILPAFVPQSDLFSRRPIVN